MGSGSYATSRIDLLKDSMARCIEERILKSIAGAYLRDAMGCLRGGRRARVHERSELT